MKSIMELNVVFMEYGIIYIQIFWKRVYDIMHLSIGHYRTEYNHCGDEYSTLWN